MRLSVQRLVQRARIVLQYRFNALYVPWGIFALHRLSHLNLVRRESSAKEILPYAKTASWDISAPMAAEKRRRLSMRAHWDHSAHRQRKRLDVQLAPTVTRQRDRAKLYASSVRGVIFAKQERQDIRRKRIDVPKDTTAQLERRRAFRIPAPTERTTINSA